MQSQNVSGCSRKIVRYDRANIYGKDSRWEEICCEGSGGAEKEDHSLTLHFCNSFTMESSYKIRKVLCFLVVNHHGLQWENGMVPYSMANRLITMTVTDTEKDDDDDNDNKTLVYIKASQKHKWLKDMLESGNDMIIETLDIDSEDVKSLKNLDNINTMRYKKHIKNCALQNVFKIFNW